jgi:hypothetical protein
VGTVATTFTLFSDYHQISVLDGASSTDTSVGWSRFDEPLHSHLSLAEDAIAVMTGVNGNVTVTIEVTAGPPADDSASFQHVTECSLRADSGELVVTAPTYGPDDGDRVPVPAGWLRLRTSLAWSPFDDDEIDGLDDSARRIRIQCWLAPPTSAVLIKGWDPVTATET